MSSPGVAPQYLGGLANAVLYSLVVGNFATVSALANEQPQAQPALYTLTSTQQRNLGQLVQFTLSPDGGYHPTTSEEDDLGAATSEQQCLSDLVRVVDRAFTHTVPAHVREMLWDRDRGITSAHARAIVSHLEDRLKNTPHRPLCASQSAGFQREALQRIVTALIKGCQRGKTGNFQALQSVADTLLVTALGDYGTHGFVCMLILAMCGACILLDRLVITQLLFRPEKVPCQCPLCEKAIVRGEEIGRGAFGKVYKCKFASGGRTRVLKSIAVDLNRDVNALQDAINEARCLIQLRHRHIVAIDDVFVHRNMAEHTRGWWSLGRMVAEGVAEQAVTGDYVCIVMEHCEGVLLDFVASGVPLALDVLLGAVSQLSAGLAYMHRCGAIHCDIKLENIFLSRSAEDPSVCLLKIGDLGLTTMGAHRRSTRSGGSSGSTAASPPFVVVDTQGEGEEEDEVEDGVYDTVAQAGTAPYMPPESFGNADSDVGPAVDAWGLGCAIWEATTCRSLPTARPYLGHIAKTREWDAHLAKMRLELEESLRAMALVMLMGRGAKPDARRTRDIERAVVGLVALLQELLHPDPSQRPELGDVCDRAWLKPFADTAFRPMGSALGKGRGRSQLGVAKVKSTMGLTPRKLNYGMRPLTGGASSPMAVA